MTEADTTTGGNTVSEQAVMWGDSSFPWPQATKDQRVLGTTGAMVEAMNWPGLTLAERCVALFIADGYCGPETDVDALAARLGVSSAELMDLMWSLLRKGFMQAIAGRWA